MKVLLIDDELVCGELAALAISHQYPGSALQQVISCAAGFQKLAEQAVDAVILDLRLSNEEGIDCLRQLRRRWPEMPVVILTGMPGDEIKEKCIEAGADDYCIKTAMAETLGLKVWLAIEGRRDRMKASEQTERRVASVDRLSETLRKKSN